MVTRKIVVDAAHARETETGVEGGMDVDVSVSVDGLELSGGVTLVRDHTGEWSSWGSRDHWVSGDLLQLMGSHMSDARCIEVLDAIEGAAARACRRASVL